jgi:hypothetical protein
VISSTRLPISCFLVTPAPMELVANEDQTKLSFTKSYCVSESDLFWVSVLEGELVSENEFKFSYLSRLFKREHSDWFWTIASCHIMQHLPTGKGRLEKLNSFLSMFKDEYNQAFACFKLCSLSQSNYERRVLGHWAYRKARKCSSEKVCHFLFAIAITCFTVFPSPGTHDWLVGLIHAFSWICRWSILF